MAFKMKNPSVMKMAKEAGAAMKMKAPMKMKKESGMKMKKESGMKMKKEAAMKMKKESGMKLMEKTPKKLMEKTPKKMKSPMKEEKTVKLRTGGKVTTSASGDSKTYDRTASINKLMDQGMTRAQAIEMLDASKSSRKTGKGK
jgi:hypothetical protein